MLRVGDSLDIVLLIAGTLSIIVGSIALKNQWLIKRFFAFSGISHIGFLLLALYSLDYHAFIIYILIYGITTVNIFTIIVAISEYLGRDLKFITDLSGLLRINPFLSIALALNILSLAGVCQRKILWKTRKALSALLERY
jgi:NADH-quinone oxidoreductase subunit N